MISIYAQTFMTATRSGYIHIRDMPPVPHEKRLNWISRRKTRGTDTVKV